MILHAGECRSQGTDSRSYAHRRTESDNPAPRRPQRILLPCSMLLSGSSATHAIFGPLRFSLHEPSVAGNTVMPYGMWVPVAVSSSVANSLEVREPIKGPEKNSFVPPVYMTDPQNYPPRWLLMCRTVVHFLGDISAKNYQNQLMYVEVIACHVISLLRTQCGIGIHMRFVIPLPPIGNFGYKVGNHFSQFRLKTVRY